MFASPKSFSLNSRAEAWPGKSFVCSICGERGRLARAGRSLYPWNDASKATWICPEGTYENSPTLQRWESEPERVRPEGTAEMALSVSRPFRDCCAFIDSCPTLKRWAILNHPYGMYSKS